jgi:hypothetical protein
VQLGKLARAGATRSREGTTIKLHLLPFSREKVPTNDRFFEAPLSEMTSRQLLISQILYSEAEADGNKIRA